MLHGGKGRGQVNVPIYSVERVFSSPVSALWAAWTDRRLLEQWYCPVGLHVIPDSVTSDPVVGGWWAVGVDASAFGIHAYFYGRYTDVSPHHFLAHRLHYTEDPDEFLARPENTPADLVEVHFSPELDGVRVRFSQFGHLPLDQADQAREGMESYFDNLHRFLDRP